MKMIQDAEEEETKQAIADSIRQQAAKEDEENKKLEDEFFTNLSAQAQNNYNTSLDNNAGAGAA